MAFPAGGGGPQACFFFPHLNISKLGVVSIKNRLLLEKHFAMSLPPANLDPNIPVLRHVLSNIYVNAFDAFPYLRTILDELQTLASSSGSKNLKDDISWARESLEGDSEKLFKIQSHIKFLQAEETFTTKNEMIKVFKEFVNFVQMILLDDLITTLKGVATTMTNQENDHIKLNNRTLDEIVKVIQRFSVALKLSSSPVLEIETNDLGGEITLSNATITQLQNQLELRSKTLTETVEALRQVSHGPQ